MSPDGPSSIGWAAARRAWSIGLRSMPVALLLAAMTDPTPLGAQTGWLPREVRLAGGLTGAQRTAAIARLEQVEQVLRQVPELARPDGFEIMPVIVGGSRMLGPGDAEQPGHVVEYVLQLAIFVPSKANAQGRCTCLWVTVNKSAPVGPAAIRDAQGRAIYVEAGRGEPVPHATQVYGGLLEARERSIVEVLLTSADAVPWQTVTREEFYDATILDREDGDGEKQADVRSALSKTPYEEWMEGAEERRKTREQTLSEAARFQTPAEVAKLRQALEANEREVTEQLRRSEAADRDRNTNALSASRGLTDSLRVELARMSAAERRMPALIDNALPEGPIATGWRMAPEDSPAAWRVLMPNYDFWRARHSPVEVRSLTVQIFATGAGLIPQVHKALLRAFHTLDWAAFNQLLDVPR